MKRRIFVLVLALALVLTMSAVPGFAATKHVVQVSEKDYDIDENGTEELTWSWQDTYKNGLLQKYKIKSIDKNYDWNEETGEEIVTKEEIERVTTYSYKNGRTSQTVTTENGKKSSKTVYKYKNKKISTITRYNYDGGYKKSAVTKYTYGKNKTTSTTTYVGNDPTTKNVSYYNNKGRLTKSEYYIGGKKNSTTTYTYWDNGNMKKSVQKSEESTYTSTYNKKGLEIKTVSEYKDSKYVYTYKYNSNGLKTEEVFKSTYKIDGNNQTNTTTTKFKYSNYYGSTKKYPKTVKIYTDGKYTRKEIREYKKI